MAKKSTRKKTTRKAASKSKQKPRKSTRKPKILTTEQITRASIAGARKLLVEFSDELGNEVLRQRRALGLPDPDGAAFGKQLLRWQLALAALTIAAGEEGFNPNNVHDALLEALRNPVTGAKPTPWEVARWANTLYGEALQIIRDEVGFNDCEEEPEEPVADAGAGAGADPGAYPGVWQQWAYEDVSWHWWLYSPERDGSLGEQQLDADSDALDEPVCEGAVDE